MNISLASFLKLRVFHSAVTQILLTCSFNYCPLGLILTSRSHSLLFGWSLRTKNVSPPRNFHPHWPMTFLIQGPEPSSGRSSPGASTPPLPPTPKHFHLPGTEDVMQLLLSCLCNHVFVCRPPAVLCLHVIDSSVALTKGSCECFVLRLVNVLIVLWLFMYFFFFFFLFRSQLFKDTSSYALCRCLAWQVCC